MKPVAVHLGIFAGCIFAAGTNPDVASLRRIIRIGRMADVELSGCCPRRDEQREKEKCAAPGKGDGE
jgi:hypothetical protein